MQYGTEIRLYRLRIAVEDSKAQSQNAKDCIGSRIESAAECWGDAQFLLGPRLSSAAAHCLTLAFGITLGVAPRSFPLWLRRAAVQYAGKCGLRHRMSRLTFCCGMV